MGEKAMVSLSSYQFTTRSFMQKFIVPIALLASVLILMVAIIVFRKSPEAARPLDATNIPAVTEADHIQGNLMAAVTIIEYSDIECPFCKQFETSMKRIMDEYGPSGKVALVFRHYPLTSIHPNAEKHAEAAECAASLKTPETFFDFIAAMHVKAPGEVRFNPKDYAEVATSLGIDAEKLQACVDAGAFADHIAANRKEAEDAGATGTPFLVFVDASGVKTPFGGALSYAQVKQIIDKAIALPASEATSTVPKPN